MGSFTRSFRRPRLAKDNYVLKSRFVAQPLGLADPAIVDTPPLLVT